MSKVREHFPPVVIVRLSELVRLSKLQKSIIL